MICMAKGNHSITVRDTTHLRESNLWSLFCAHLRVGIQDMGGDDMAIDWNRAFLMYADGIGSAVVAQLEMDRIRSDAQRSMNERRAA